MSSLRLVHPKRDPARGEELSAESCETAESSPSARLQSMVEKIYKLDNNPADAVQVFDQLVDDLLAEARGDAKPVGGGQ
jgi:hypothetical protein